MATTTERVKLDSGGSRAGGGRVRERVTKAWPSVAVLVAALVAWQIVVEVRDVSEYVVARPTEIGEEILASQELLVDATWVTTQEIVYGFLISVGTGVVIAVALTRFDWLYRAVYPLIVLFQVVPKVALAPIFILWFGYGMGPKLLLIVVIAFFPVALNMLVGLRSVDSDLIWLMKSVGSSRNQILTRIQLPTSLPYLFAGMRIAITLSVIGAVVAEFSGASNGLGFLIQFASTQLDTPLMFAALTLVSVLGLVLYYAISLVEMLLGRRFPHIRADSHPL